MVDRDSASEHEPSPERSEDVRKRFKTLVENFAVVAGQDPTDMDPVRYGTYYLPPHGPVPYDRVVFELYQFRDEENIDEATGESYYVEYHKVILKDGDITVHETTLENDSFYFVTDNGTDIQYPSQDIEHQKVAHVLDALQQTKMIPDEETEGAFENLAHPIDLAGDIGLDRLQDYKTDKLLVAVHHATFRRLLIERYDEDTVGFSLYGNWLPVSDAPEDPITWLRRRYKMTRVVGREYIEVENTVQVAKKDGDRWVGGEDDFYQEGELSDKEQITVDADMVAMLCYMLRSRSRYDSHVEGVGEEASAILAPHPLES